MSADGEPAAVASCQLDAFGTGQQQLPRSYAEEDLVLVRTRWR